MKKIIFFVLLISLSQIGNSDYIFMCTFFQNPVAKVFKMSDDGTITYLYSFEVGGYPESLVFSPDGHWGLVGGNTTTNNPANQITSILVINKNQIVSLLNKVTNKNYSTVTISPDSKYGLFGTNLQTIKFNHWDNTYKVVTNSYPEMSAFAAISKLNNKIYGGVWYKVEEYMLLDDGMTTSTGFILDIRPSAACRDLDITPDGKTCIFLSLYNYQLTVIKIRPEGGCELIQQFDTKSGNPDQMEITTDGKFLLVVFDSTSTNKGIRSFSIGEDSKLTEVGSVSTPYGANENLAVSPDGKYAVTRWLDLSGTTFNVVRINSDGTLEYLPEKDFKTTGHVSAIDFLPPYKEYLTNSWMLY